MQAKSTRYEPPAINFHLSETPPREPQGGGERTEYAAPLRLKHKEARSLIPDDAGRLDQRHPLVDLGSHQVSQRLRLALGVRRQIRAQLRQPLGNGLVPHGLVERRIDALDDRLRRRSE